MTVSPVAVITGASSGIGRATALHLAELGYRVGVGYRAQAEAAKDVVESVHAAGSEAVAFQVDLAEPAAAAAAVEAVTDELGGLDAFVNNAGVNRRGHILEETVEDFERVLAIDLTGPFACAQAAARRMVEQGRGGRIVNVSSVHEMIPIMGGSAYCAAKGGLGMLTQVMALELAAHGITVNAVSPGETATPMNGVPDDLDAADIRRPKIPVGRPGRSSEVAALIGHLLRPEAAYVTGVSIPIDGGLMLMSAVPNAQYAGRLDSPDETRRT